MTPYTEASNTTSKKKEPDTKENLWSSILSDVQTRSSNKLPSYKQVLVLGDNESGKTTLVAKLQGVEDPKKGSGLEYAYIDVRDEYRDDHTRLSVWVLDGDPGHGNLLRFALNEETFPHTLVILTVSMTTPWGILDQLQHWASVLADHIDKLSVDNDVRQQCKQRIMRAWQDYVDILGDDLELPSPLRRTARSITDSTSENGILNDMLDDEGLPLPDGVLTHNLGVDIVVVVTKTDYMSTLEKEQDYRDEHLDFMQLWIRRFCLQYGAALFYTSAKEDKNCDLLYKYLTHRIYGLPFRTPALVVEKDAVFVPAGWDNLKKVSILNENLHSCKPDDYYRDIIVQPVMRKTVSRETEIQAEDEQVFLARQQQILLAGGGLAPTGPRISDVPMRSPALGIKASPRPVGAAGGQGSPMKIEGSKVVGSPGGEGVLANFFNSLLHKKTGAGSPAGSSAPGTPKSGGGEGVVPDKAAAMRCDAAAELDRLVRSKKSASPSVDLNSSDC